jgi:4,5-dihydroxyphthalate decarboxylase
VTDIHLTLACGTYDINRALIDGEVRPQGVDLTVLTYPSPQRHWRMGRHAEFDVCEFSMSTFLMLQGRGDNPFIAIPAFPHRRFRHSFIFVNANAGIRSPKDLEGRRVALRSWQTTAGLWARGILSDEYGVDLRKISWLCQDEEDVPFTPPVGYSIERVPEGKTVTGMLEEGEVDCLIYPEMPASVMRGDPRVTRLFPDYKAEEMAHFKKTGFFPIMHTVIVRRDVLAENPWVAFNVLEAFRQSKALAFKRMEDPRSVSLGWFRDALEEQQRVLGPDPWNYTFEGNRSALEAMIRWSCEQGMIDHIFPAEEMFVPSTLDELPHYV